MNIDPEHTIVSKILTDLIFKRNDKRRAVSLEPTNEPAKHPSSSNEFQNSNRHNYYHQQKIKFNLECLEIEGEKCLFSIESVDQSLC
jgi:hypothetical protein